MKVYFDGNYRSHRKYQKPCRSLNIQKEFDWKGYTWRILDIYICGRGLVIDFAKQIPVQELQNFLNKWQKLVEERELTQEEESLLEFENPNETRVSMKAWVNGREIQNMSGCSVCYNPLAGQPAARDWEMPKEEELIEYYGLDKKQGWGFWRWNLKWDYKRIPRKLNLELNFKPDKHQLPCQETFETIPGDSNREILFTHPFSGEKFTLVIRRVTKGRLEEKMFGHNKDYRYPLQYQILEYYIAGEGQKQKFMVRDVQRGDSPIKGKAVTEKSARSVAVIGGADGPTSIFLAKPAPDATLAVTENGKESITVKETVSRLKFEPVEKTNWQIYAMVEQGEEKTFSFKLI